MLPFMPSGLFPVGGTVGGVTFNTGVTCDVVSLKNVQMAWIHIYLTRTNTHNELYTPVCGVSVASCATALPQDVPIWKGVTSTTVTQLVRQTDAKNYTMLNSETGPCHLIFQIDPAVLSSSGAAYDCLGLTISDPTHADVIGTVVYWLLPRYQSKVSSMTANEFIID
jgi:hypothetical protein